MKIVGSLIIICASVGASVASPKLEVLDRGDAVEVIAHDVKAADTTLTSVRSRIEVPVVGAPTLNMLSNDKTVKVIEMTGAGRKNLSIKLGMERPVVAALTKQAQAIQIGNDLHVIIPRAVVAPGAVANLPEPTLSPELAAKAAAIAPVIEEAKPVVETKPIVEEKPVVEAKTDVVAVEPTKTEPVVETKTETPAVARTEEKPAAKAEKIAKAEEPKAFRNFPMLLALVLAAVGCFAWMKRKKKTVTRDANTIEVIAQKSLGGKAKIVWLQAGGREIVVSVTPQAVRMMGSWKKSADSAANANSAMGDVMAALPEARTVSQQIPVVTEKAKSTSPAVSGLLKLRARTGIPAVNEEVATDDVDADALWAKEILAATTGARR